MSSEIESINGFPGRMLHIAAGIIAGDRAFRFVEHKSEDWVEGVGGAVPLAAAPRNGRGTWIKRHKFVVDECAPFPAWRRLANAITNLQEFANSNAGLSPADRALFYNALAMHYAKIGAEIEATLTAEEMRNVSASLSETVDALGVRR